MAADALLRGPAIRGLPYESTVYAPDAAQDGLPRQAAISPLWCQVQAFAALRGSVVSRFELLGLDFE